MRSVLTGDAPTGDSPDLNELMTDGCARVLTLETENLRLGDRISELAAEASDPTAANELRRLWVRRRALAAELGELRGLLRQLGGARRGVLA
jgi:hypothetical protein